MESDTLAAPYALTRVDHDIFSRFATCCRALWLSVHDRQRPADLTEAHSGFAALTHIAHEQCDAWTGLAAVGEADARVVESIWRTSATAGVVQRHIGLAAGELGFVYDTGLYLQLRAADPDDFQLAYAAVLSDGVRDAAGYVAAYRVAVDGFDEVVAAPSTETWAVLEITGTAADLRSTAACAIRTNDKPVNLEGVKPLNGRHRPALDALNPLSAQRLDALIGT